jgi:hypothetical protein
MSLQMLADPLTQMAEAENDVTDAVPGEQSQLMIDERPSGYYDERFRDLLSDRP